jgi:phage gpG-like protein
VTPGGDPWPERKIEGDGHPLLMDTGALLQAATAGGAGHIVVLEPRSLEFGIDADSIRYAATHEFGSPDRNIPPRSYLGAGEETLDNIGDEIADEGESFF